MVLLMTEVKIQSLFSTPIYMTNMDRPFTKQELQFVNEQKKNCVKNTGNINTKDNYILNRKEFSNIKKFLNRCCKDYLNKVICPKDNIQLYITQSWLNFTETNQFHHQHNHQNSVISGVLYLNCDKKNDKIFFLNPKTYEQIKPKINNFNIWNSETWWFPLETTQLIMFPSSITHQVDTKKGNNTRVSLAFNTFYKGTLGSNASLTELKL
tara:strand:- start:734 stop:1363 length:630 start_codon:yes stop_codon:yes gene_type:complete